MKKFNVKSFAAGMVVMALLTGATGFAETLYKTISVEVDAVKKIVINGEDRTPGADKQPFIYNDTTYVPLRYISEAMYKEVKWDNGNIDIGGVKVDKQETDAVYAAIDLNFKHAKEEDIAGYMSDISSKVDASLITQTSSAMTQIFTYFDLDYKVISKELVSFDGNACDVRVVTETRKTGGAYTYNDNRSTSILKLYKENGTWKMGHSYIEKVEPV